ncbi:regulator of nonsense transcripts 1 [Geosmithia morbida]|uniref:Regulator of nonsense transcripts 1 n=1 Tax=Geosmithia morbida TaxID=1094350 RepID=A0A9P5D362_9HYPO|nr:regulator of nonsense transcripts 1 [Geosmithia morbida]KAF4124577.1 regulator of nonsense transcripts 1 [Geosmithia morbida]
MDYPQVSHSFVDSDPTLVLHTFPVQDAFVWRHEQGTMIEMGNEAILLKRFNDRRTPFRCWPISPIPGFTTSFAKSWLLMVKVPPVTDDVGFPADGDHFSVDLERTVMVGSDGYTLTNLSSSRITNPYEEMTDVDENIRRCAAFKVDVPRSWEGEGGTSIELELMDRFRIASSIDDVQNITVKAKSQIITIHLETVARTPEAELEALRSFVFEKGCHGGRTPPAKSMTAFRTIQNFHGVTWEYTDLHAEFPQLANPTSPSYRVSPFLQQKVKEFNADQKAAYDGLTQIRNGLFFVNGCPGSGKTEWNLVLSALIQSSPRQGSKRKRSPILFLVDINKTADDAANRYLALCKASGLNTKAIRMYGWPYEMRNSDKLQGLANLENLELDDKDSKGVDFTRTFLTTANLARNSSLKRGTDRAPTLDEASWDYYDLRRDEKAFTPLSVFLDKMGTGEALSTSDWKVMRKLVSQLYRKVLAEVDFVATTPVAASGAFSRFFRPGVVFFDEAPHARELSTLIPIAYFEPLAWIFTGDVHQTQPFVKGADKRSVELQGLRYNPFVEQLRFSTMARAATVGALDGQLLVNKRAHGNLHRLSSELFYSASMRSVHETPGAMYPPSTLHLKKHLESLGGNRGGLSENRIIVQLDSGCEREERRSFWNPVNHRWVMKQVEILLKDEAFQSTSSEGSPGTVIIMSPYSTALRRYDAAVKQWPDEWRRRVQVLTVDRAQGNQADVVVLDMVLTTRAGFMDDCRRLNVAITRARQAEIIVMHEMMTMRRARVKTRYTSRLWDDAAADGRVFKLEA